MAFQYGEGQAGSGWEENCGISLFTLDWLDCGDPPECLPWIGSGWTAFCVDQLYTLSWICCDITVGEPPDTGGGGHPVKGRRPKLFGEDIEFEAKVKKLKVVVKRIGLATEKGVIPENALTYKLEIERFEAAIELIEEKIVGAEAEILFLEDAEEVDLQIKREFLIEDVVAAKEFQLDLISQVEILKLIKRKRQDEETIIAMLMMTDPNMSIIIN